MKGQASESSDMWTNFLKARSGRGDANEGIRNV
jgi:hypothetical protein